MSDVKATAVSLACLIRGLPLFFGATPRTPLRVLGIIALDMLHVLRHARPLPRKRVSELAMFLDFEGCANAVWDRKEPCEPEYAAIRRNLDQAGLGLCLDAYLARLRALESRRPSIGGDGRRFDDVAAYREGVARLSLATAAAVALNRECRDEDIAAAFHDRDVDALFRVLMQCQIIDDVIDYAEDLSAGLPSFLTAAASLPQGLELTAMTSRRYAASSGAPARQLMLPLRLALAIVSALAQVVVRAAHYRHHHAGELGVQIGR